MPKTVKKASITKPPEAKVRGPVKQRRAARGHVPTVSKKPRSGSRERKVIQQVEQDIPFWQKVKNEYFV